MTSVTTRLGRITLALLLGCVGLIGEMSPASAPASQAAPAARESVTSLRPEVRLRKLHLVRPDLIQYPLAYDIYC